jgi:hypothetical protein
LDNDLNNPQEEEDDRVEQERERDRDEKLSPIDRSGPSFSSSSSSIGHSHSLPHHRSPAYQMVKKKEDDQNNPNYNPSRQKHGYSSFRIEEDLDDDGDDEEQFQQQEEEDGEQDDSPVIKNPMIR